MAVLGPRFCARAFSSCGERGPLFIAVRGPLTIAASPVVEHRLQTRRLSSCGSRAQPLRGMWDLPRPGLEPVSPALAGRLSTTAPPGKPRRSLLKWTKLKQNEVVKLQPSIVAIGRCWAWRLLSVKKGPSVRQEVKLSQQQHETSPLERKLKTKQLSHHAVHKYLVPLSCTTPLEDYLLLAWRSSIIVITQ